MTNPIKISSQYIRNYTGSLYVWALGNVGDKILITTTISVQNYAISTIDSPFIFNHTDGMIGAGWIYDPQGQFGGFNIGDTLIIFNQADSTNQTRTIVDKLDNNNIQVDSAFAVSPNTDLPGFVISVTTPIKSIKYHYNFVENAAAPSFKSIVDATLEQEIIIRDKAASDVTVTAMEPLGTPEWQDGLTGFLTKKFDGTSTPVCTIAGVGIDDGTTDGVYKSNYLITHYTKVTPYILVDQITNQIAGLPPVDFEQTKCWKLITMIEAAESFTNPNFLVSEVFDSVLGNIGWYGENFNTGKTNYSISNIVYNNGGVIDGIKLAASETTVTFNVNNTVDTPFSNNNTQFLLALFKVPSDPAEYQNNGRLLDVNFLFDRKQQTVGSAAANGDNYGGSYQILKDVQATFVSSSQILVTAKISMAVAVLAGFVESSTPRYFIYFSVKNHTLATNVSDLVSLPVAISEFVIDNSDPTMITIDSAFLRHPESDIATEGSPDLTCAKEDEIVAYSKFYIENDTRESDTILIKDITVKIKAKNSVTEAEFNLDSFAITSVDQNINTTIARPFHIPIVEIRKNIVIQRRFDLDSGEQTWYSILFPFKLRWEDWIALPGANVVFFNSAQDNNGLNQDWHHYSLVANWGIYYEIEVVATKNGVPEGYTQEILITTKDYASNTVYNATSIKSYDGITELVNAGTKYLLGYKDTRIVASFKHTDNSAFDLTKCVVNMLIEVFEQGGVTGQRRMSSLWVSASDTWFKSIDTSNKTILTLATTTGANDTVKATVDVDYFQIPVAAAFKITARLYELTIPPYDLYKNFEDDEDFEFEDSDPYEFEG